MTAHDLVHTLGQLTATGLFAIFWYMEKLYILMHREMQFSGKGDPDHWSEIVIAQSTDKSFIDKIVKDNNLALGDINDMYDFNHKYFVKEMDIPFINEYVFNLYHLKKPQ